MEMQIRLTDDSSAPASVTMYLEMVDAVGQFLDEIRAPLTGLAGFSELLLGENVQKQALEDARVINAEVVRSLRLLNHFSIHLEDMILARGTTQLPS